MIADRSCASDHLINALTNMQTHLLKPTIPQISRKIYSADTCDSQGRALHSGTIDLRALSHGHYLGTPIPNNILPGLNSIGFWNATGPQNWGVDAHCNDGIKIMFLETGQMPFVVDQKQFSLRAGNFTVTRPWQRHQLGAPHIEPSKLHWLILDVGVRRPDQGWQWPEWMMLAKDDLAELTQKLRDNEYPVWDSTPVIAQSFCELARCIADWNQPHMISHMVIHLNQLFLSMLDALTNQQKSINKDLISRRRAVELFLAELNQAHLDLTELWTLDRMAAHCNMGTTAFSKYCRELVNANPVEFLNQCRLDHAARQLKEKPSLTITEIALANGFNSSQYFATAFRERFHKSPRAYRES